MQTAEVPQAALEVQRHTNTACRRTAKMRSVSGRSSDINIEGLDVDRGSRDQSVATIDNEERFIPVRERNFQRPSNERIGAKSLGVGGFEQLNLRQLLFERRVAPLLSASL